MKQQTGLLTVRAVQRESQGWEEAAVCVAALEAEKGWLERRVAALEFELGAAKDRVAALEAEKGCSV